MKDENERMRLLMRQALDDAFKLQIAQLYKIWLTNPGELEAAQKRAAVGVGNAVQCYRLTLSAIEKWEG